MVIYNIVKNKNNHNNINNSNNIKEGYGSGALYQLESTGPQDSYLTGDVPFNIKYPNGLYIGKYPYYQYMFNNQYNEPYW